MSTKILKEVSFCMPAQWTGELIGKMHIHGITLKELADHMDRNPKYVSAVINGHCEPAKAEEQYMRALDELIEQKKEVYE